VNLRKTQAACLDMRKKYGSTCYLNDAYRAEIDRQSEFKPLEQTDVGVRISKNG
jgi:hypothetical protein